MPTSEPAHVALRSVCDLANEVASRVPTEPAKTSPRGQETKDVRAASGGGGRTRADLLDEIARETVVVLANGTLLVHGVADCLQIAAGRDNAVNTPALSSVLRPALEVAGQLTWLLDDSIDGHERGRRFLIWRLGDLRNQRHVLREFRPGSDEEAAASQVLDETEAELLAIAASAKWQARSSIVAPNGDVQAAALLDRAGQKPEPMPKINALVRLVSSTASLYGLLSVPTHGMRFGLMHGLTAADPTDTPTAHVKTDARVSGFGLPPNLAIGLACLAIDIPTRHLAGWNGIDPSAMHSRVVEVMQAAGIG
jgi:hypothetical protein